MTSLAITLMLYLLASDPAGVPAYNISDGTEQTRPSQQDDPYSVNYILNGRVWRNLYSRVRGHQFYLHDDYLLADINFNGKAYKNLKVKYDILNDELILSIDSHPVIILNKEMVDDFTLHYLNQDIYFFNAGTDTASLLKGYINVLYDGPTSLYVKQKKMIQPLAVEGRYDEFYEENKIYIRKDGEIVQVNTRKSLLDKFAGREKELKSYINSRKLKVTNKDPYSFIPVLKRYDGRSE